MEKKIYGFIRGKRKGFFIYFIYKKETNTLKVNKNTNELKKKLESELKNQQK
jgi:hypothetical protein